MSVTVFQPGKRKSERPISGETSGFFPDHRTSLKIGTWEWDVTRDIVRCCGVTSFLFGIGPDDEAAELPLQRFVQMMHRNDRKRFRELIGAVCQYGGTFQAEYRTTTASGELRRLLGRGEFSLGDDGRVAWGRGIVVDLTDYAPTALRFKASSMASRTREPALLPHMADHLLAAWEIGQFLPSEVLNSLKPAFQDLLFELGLRIAEAELKLPVRKKRSRLH